MDSDKWFLGKLEFPGLNSRVSTGEESQFMGSEGPLAMKFTKCVQSMK